MGFLLKQIFVSMDHLIVSDYYDIRHIVPYNEIYLRPGPHTETRTPHRDPTPQRAERDPDRSRKLGNRRGGRQASNFWSPSRPLVSGCARYNTDEHGAAIERTVRSKTFHFLSIHFNSFPKYIT
jgi:hypothetical protein